MKHFGFCTGPGAILSLLLAMSTPLSLISLMGGVALCLASTQAHAQSSDDDDLLGGLGGDDDSGDTSDAPKIEDLEVPDAPAEEEATEEPAAEEPAAEETKAKEEAAASESAGDDADVDADIDDDIDADDEEGAKKAADKAAEKDKKIDGTVQSLTSMDKVKAVARKALLKRKRVELAPAFATSVNDAFYIHMGVGGSLTFYPHDSFGIAASGMWFLGHPETGRIDDVRSGLISVPADFAPVQAFAGLDLQWSPIYGKMSLLGSAIVPFDFYFLGGMGIAYTGAHSRSAARFGIGQRFVLNEWLTVRVELKDHIFVDTHTVSGQVRSDIQNYLMVQVGVGVFVPPSFEYSR